MNRTSTRVACIAALFVAGCASTPQTSQNVPLTPPGETAGAPVVRRPLPEPSPAPPATARATPAPGGSPKVIVPAGLLYVCVTESGGVRKEVGIELAPKVHDLCSRHPEMGPCQYERQSCRNAGGRVFARSGEEITLGTEAEYDKKVLRVRFRAN